MGFFKIFPPIGVARVGNSEQFYLAPETPGTDGKGSLPIPVKVVDDSVQLPVEETESPFSETDFRDGDRKMCRQAVRFRIFYYESQSDNNPKEVVVTKGSVDANTQIKATKIIWKVRIANKKASWYEFLTQNGVDGYPPNHPLRNSKVTGDDRYTDLVIAPSLGTLEAKDGSLDVSYQFKKDNGGNWPSDLGSLNPSLIDCLGAMYLDKDGHLVFVGGYGKSGSKDKNPEINSYANNDGWWDDTSDGPVSAEVYLGEEPPGTVVEYPAWVIVTPPAYAPEIPHVVTLHDAMLDVAVRHLNYKQPDGEGHEIIDENGFWNAEYKPNWATQIKPILDRVSLTSWVAAIPPKPHKFDDSKLGETDSKYNSLRQYFFTQIRPPEQKNALKSETTGYPMMPYLAGDDAIGSGQKSSKYLTLPDTQYFFLKQWANGNFTAESLTLLTKPEELTMASLEACVGGAFSPGIEMTWICRNPKLYQEPFRIKHKLSWDNLSTQSPLSLATDWNLGFEPGDATKYMALPWQADFDVCTVQPIDRLVWWWPAQRPLFVYLDPRPPVEPPSDELLKQVPDETIKDKQVAWVGTSYDQNADDYLSLSYLEMVQQWHKLGFILDISQTKRFRSTGLEWEGSYFAEVERKLSRE